MAIRLDALPLSLTSHFSIRIKKKKKKENKKRGIKVRKKGSNKHVARYEGRSQRGVEISNFNLVHSVAGTETEINS